MSPTVENVSRTDTGLASELRVSVARLSRRVRSERVSGDDLTVSQRSVLALLHRNGESTVGQLAEADRVRPPSMTRTVNCLVEAGYVVRRACERDKRQVLVDLSEKGRDTVAEDRRARDAWLAQRLREFTPEEVAVLRQAAPLIERLAHA